MRIWAGVAVLALLAAGCQGRWPAGQGLAPADGSRLEYRTLPENADGSVAYVKTADDEKHARSAPVKVPVWRTRPGPQTGDFTHDELTPDFIGTQKRDAAGMMQVMGMTPAEGGAYYDTAAAAEKTRRPARALPAKQKKRDGDGFREDGPEWLRSDYYGMTPEQQALLKKTKKKTAGTNRR